MGGGAPSTTTTTVDPVYNAGLLKLSQEEQGWAKEMYNQFKFGVPYDPNEQVSAYRDASGKLVEYKGGTTTVPNETSNQVRQAIGLGPSTKTMQVQNTPPSGLETTTRGVLEGYNQNAQTSEMQYLQNLVNANQDLLGLQTNVSKQQLGLQSAQIGAQQELLPIATGVAKQRYGLATTFLNDINKGIDVNSRMNQAQAGVQHGFTLARKANERNISSYGLDPNSSLFAAGNRELALKEASGISGARTQAQIDAEREDFARKQAGLNFQV
jgi:hypothetical protein